MKKYDFRIKELKELNRIVVKIDPSITGSWGTTFRSNYAKEIFGKASKHAISLSKLWPSSDEEKRQIDASSIAGIARSIIECHNVFQYHCEYRLSKEEFEFRLFLGSYHHTVDLDKILKNFGFDESDEVRERFSIERNYAKNIIQENTFFKSLPSNVQTEVLKGNRAYFWNQMKRRHSPLKKEDESAIYKLLSNSVHSFPLGISNYTGGGTHNHLNIIGLLFLSLESALLYFANITQSYIALRWKLAKCITSNEKAFIKSLITEKYIEIWKNDRKQMRIFR